MTAGNTRPDQREAPPGEGGRPVRHAWEGKKLTDGGAPHSEAAPPPEQNKERTPLPPLSRPHPQVFHGGSFGVHGHTSQGEALPWLGWEKSPDMTLRCYSEARQEDSVPLTSEVDFGACGATFQPVSPTASALGLPAVGVSWSFGWPLRSGSSCRWDRGFFLRPRVYGEMKGIVWLRAGPEPGVEWWFESGGGGTSA